MRTTPMAGQDISVGRRDWISCRRAGGSYTIARHNTMHTPHEPDSLRLLPQFDCSFPRHRRAPKSRFDHRFPTELRSKRRGASNEATPFETTRVLDLAPDSGSLAHGRAQPILARQVVAGMQVAGQSGGMTDVTRESVPVIDQADAMPGLYRARAFSGHGLGLGQADGQLMADLVMSTPTRVNPAPFRLARFSKWGAL